MLGKQKAAQTLNRIYYHPLQSFAKWKPPSDDLPPKFAKKLTEEQE